MTVERVFCTRGYFVAGGTKRVAEWTAMATLGVDDGTPELSVSLTIGGGTDGGRAPGYPSELFVEETCPSKVRVAAGA